MNKNTLKNAVKATVIQAAFHGTWMGIVVLWVYQF